MCSIRPGQPSSVLRLSHSTEQRCSPVFLPPSFPGQTHQWERRSPLFFQLIWRGQFCRLPALLTLSFPFLVPVHIRSAYSTPTLSRRAIQPSICSRVRLPLVLPSSVPGLGAAYRR